MADVTLPSLGESVTEGIITQWFKKVGDVVARDEPLFEVSTDKVDSEMPSPAAGVLVEILAGEGDTVETGSRVAVIDESASAPSAPATAAAASAGPSVAVSNVPAAASVRVEAAGATGVVVSPVVRRILAEAPAHLTPEGALMCEVGHGRARLEAEFPRLPLLWLDTEDSEGEVFYVSAADLAAPHRKGKRRV